jgi:GTPase SAR1 family protein
VIGGVGSGKSSLMQRLLYNSFEGPAQRIAKLEQSVKFNFEISDSSSRRLAPPSLSISEAEEDESPSDEGSSSSSSIADTSSASSTLSASTSRGVSRVAVARLNFLETSNTLKAALSHGVARKILMYVFDLYDFSSLVALNELAKTVQQSPLSAHSILVGCKADGGLAQSSPLVPHIDRHLRRRSVEEGANESFVHSPRAQNYANDNRRRSMDRAIHVSLSRVPQQEIDLFRSTIGPLAYFEVSARNGNGVATLNEHLRELLLTKT